MQVNILGDNKIKRFIIFLFVIVFVIGCSKAKLTSIETGVIDTSKGPEMVKVSSMPDITKIVNKGTITIEPVAKYKISGKLVNKKRYTQWVGNVTEVTDVLMFWGQLADPVNDQYITIKGSSWLLKPGAPLKPNDVQRQMTRCYILPANDNVNKA